MARLSARERANLPDRAFAYVDSEGRRRLPINDEAHVRNALGRFERVTFEDDAAIEAAIDIQRSLTERVWPDGVDVRVRAGIHSGRPTLTESGYVGLSVHTVARLCSVAHGGQIVVSGKTKVAVAGSMPAGVRLRSL